MVLLFFLLLLLLFLLFSFVLFFPPMWVESTVNRTICVSADWWCLQFEARRGRREKEQQSKIGQVWRTVGGWNARMENAPMYNGKKILGPTWQENNYRESLRVASGLGGWRFGSKRDDRKVVRRFEEDEWVNWGKTTTTTTTKRN